MNLSKSLGLIKLIINEPNIIIKPAPATNIKQSLAPSNSFLIPLANNLNTDKIDPTKNVNETVNNIKSDILTLDINKAPNIIIAPDPAIIIINDLIKSLAFSTSEFSTSLILSTILIILSTAFSIAFIPASVNLDDTDILVNLLNDLNALINVSIFSRSFLSNFTNLVMFFPIS